MNRKSKLPKKTKRVEVELSLAALKALDMVRGEQSREEHLSYWINQHWRGSPRP